jgi:hypothetical protein
VRELLKAFADLADAVLTTVAMHTQHDTAQVIPDRGADYVMTVKASMPGLYEQLKKLPWACTPSVSPVSTGHGRRARRSSRPRWRRPDRVRRCRPGRAPAQPGHQHPAPGRTRQHRRRQPPSRPRPEADAKAPSDCMNTTLPGP